MAALFFTSNCTKTMCIILLKFCLDAMRIIVVKKARLTGRRGGLRGGRGRGRGRAPADSESEEENAELNNLEPFDPSPRKIDPPPGQIFSFSRF
jgi:hypothetical protein